MKTMEKLLILVPIHIFALMSPGPDFLIVLKSSLSGQVHKTFSLIAGISTAVATHLFFIYAGLSFVIRNSPVLYSIVVVLGCLWLIKIGLEIFFHKNKSFDNVHALSYNSHALAFQKGYFTNLLNPKALVYFVSVIAPIVNPNQEQFLFLITSMIFVLLTFFYFAMLTVLLHHKIVRNFFERQVVLVNWSFSVVIVLLAFYILFHELENALNMS